MHPECLANYTDAQWELLIRLARRVKLLGRLALQIKALDLWDATPPRIQHQLVSASVQAEKLQQLTQWELDRVLWALESFETTIIVLKGSAYRLAGVPYAEGRLSVDLDLLVPKADLSAIELLLRDKGWKHRTLTTYDEHYYRVWSHEIPPLVHPERETEVDIHHTLAPLTSRLKIDTGLLFAAAIPARGDNVKLLCPVDMTIHCAVNLFQNNELANDLRDLLDLHELMVFFSNRNADFWLQLTDRVNQLKLGHVMYYSFYFTRLVFDTPVPETIVCRLHARPGVIKRRIMHELVPLALFPQHPDKPLKSAAFARLVLYLRSHLIRMPLYILLPHLFYKTIRLLLTKIRIVRRQPDGK